MNRHDLESDFNGQSTDTLTVTATTRYTSADAVPGAVAAAFVQKYGRYAEAPTMAAVLALTDEQRLTSYACTVVSTQDTIEIVTTHMGDTLVGVAMHNGQQVGELNDGFLSAV